ncbi:hypothetical protein GCM10009557_00860 [Virgisporangium ochraceum]|uniref:Uncharacterized protein n=1 Tax=Virgisporangium ochraceum TaxID=65505 RepID=A0A8J4A3H0_9ACTN|nr:hypothetical protein [Virgisporangium ochraceum]GIJ74118.1 hypothetical protein Voc01_090350 [Virgisporangium ochraceum]
MQNGSTEAVGDRSASAASAGGAAGASGVGLQNRVFGWAAAAMAAERHLAVVGLVAGKVIRVGAQTGFDLDDVAVHTDADNFALFQVKAGLNLSRTPKGPLAKALEQAVGQYLDGRLPVANGTDRAVDSARDALVLCTDKAASESVRVHLPYALAKTASQPPGTPLLDNLSKDQHNALKIVLDHVRPLWVAGAHAAPNDEELRRFLRALHVITVDANDGESDHAAAVAILKTVLPADEADRAWLVLVAEGQAASVAQNWRDRAAIGAALSRHDIYLAPPARHAIDISKLCELSTANLRAW